MVNSSQENAYVQEFFRCKKDPIYFISNYIKVVHPVRGLVPFKLYPFQQKIINALLNHRFNILRKFRQAGCTTLLAAYALWIIVFQHHKTIPILSKGDIEATELLERVKLMYKELPDWIRPKVVEDNKHTLKLETNSVIKTRASGKEAGRGLAGSLLILDEAAFIEHIDTIWAAAYPTISTGGSVCALSTVNGVGNWFHKMYIDAVEKRNKFNPIDIRWQDHPEYKRQVGFEDLYAEMEKRGLDVDSWEEMTRSNLPVKKWLSEYECSFLGTGDTYIDGEVLQEISSKTNENFLKEDRGRLRIWQQPEPQYQYVLGADTALGRGRDYSAFHVINLYNGQQVAEYYSNKVPVNEFAEAIYRTALKYNVANVIIERNGIGTNVIDWLFAHYQYENLWMDEKGDFGYLVSQKNRERILADMEDAIRNGKIKINSTRTCDELSTFIINDQGKIEADEGYNDDLIMSLALAVNCFNNIQSSTPLDYSVDTKNLKIPDFPMLSKVNNTGTFGVMMEEDWKWLK